MVTAFVGVGFRPSGAVYKNGPTICERRWKISSCGKDDSVSRRREKGNDNGKASEFTIVTERSGTGMTNRGRRDGGEYTKYMIDDCGCIKGKEGVATNDSRKSRLKSARLFERLVEPLLPTNWEECTPGTYVEWVYWRIGRHIFRKAYFVLGTTSLLMSLGIGSNESIAISASLKWVLKDGIAMGTRLLVSTNLARLVDESPKRFFFIGDSLKALSVCVEILSLTNRDLFLLCGSAAALLKDAGGAMSGPSYRVFLDAFALCGNIGDVSSRSEGQEVIGDLIGLGLGVMTAWTLSQVFEYEYRLIPTLICYSVLVVLHLSCTARAISLVDIPTLNLQRVNTILDHFFADGRVPTVAEVNRSERFVRDWDASKAGRLIKVGGSLGQFRQAGVAIQRGKRRGDRFAVLYEDGTVGVLIQEEATVQDVLTGTLQARKLVEYVGFDEDRVQHESVEKVMDNSYTWAMANVSRFVQALNESGWSTNRLLFGRDFRYRV